ncbi:GNAT family N-acetyltransferase [Actinokineospora cianjurensis]|uniref:Acetyltransferase (GNAT) family protein n=1 Tax=Actinokineospora cianjurensis TaxID=585224 RepID=A0A421AWR9_9PSEU|nr:GNAT family N-acetyltransferase [Actinokineospora cianjurensis]RLK54234.1 acetyltransferase (GNAT) family protein [Actinokineospora cianjurensis]
MPLADPLASRIAAAQLSGLSRARRVVGDDGVPVLLQTRQVVPAGPFTGLIAVDGPAYLSYAVASRPGDVVDDAGEVARGLELLREVFPAGTLRFELIAQACPGAAELLQAAGLRVTARVPVMTLEPERVRVPDTGRGVTIDYVDAEAGRIAGARVASAAFGMPVDLPSGPPPEPADGGSVLATVDGEAVAVASWTQVADGITEIVGVATAAQHRRRGLGALVTAHAVRVAADLGGADLTWLTPGGDDADRVYRTVGFTTAANAVHLVEPGA